MHGDLAKWLRVLGHDTSYAEPSLSDGEVLRIAEAENRIVLTSDRRFPPSSLVVKLPPHASLEELLRFVCQLFPPEEKKFFSRCVKCNTLLTPTVKVSMCSLPRMVRERYSGEFKYCSNCKKLFWRGSHLLRMVRTLRRWGLANISDSYVLSYWNNPEESTF